MPKNPCHKCDLRILNCHSNCPSYLAYRQDLDDINEARVKYKALHQNTVFIPIKHPHMPERNLTNR